MIFSYNEKNTVIKSHAKVTYKVDFRNVRDLLIGNLEKF